MDSFSDEQFQQLLEDLGQTNDVEPFEGFMNNLDIMPDLSPFNSLCDPSIIPLGNHDSNGLFCFPPLPSIEEIHDQEEILSITHSEDELSVHSIPTPLPDNNEALEMAHWVKLLVDMQQAKQDAMRVEWVCPFKSHIYI